MVYTLPLTASSAPTFALTLPNRASPNWLCNDRYGELFVIGGNVIYVYEPPYTAASVPAAQFTLPNNNAAFTWGCAVDPVHGELVVGSSSAYAGEGKAYIYRPPFTAANVAATLQVNPNFVGAIFGGIAFDAAGDLVAQDNPAGSGVSEPGTMVYARAPFTAASHVQFWGSAGVSSQMIFDAQGNLYCGGCNNGSSAGWGVGVYAAPIAYGPNELQNFVVDGTPYSGLFFPTALTIDSSQQLYVEFGTDTLPLQVAVFTTPLTASSMPSLIITPPGNNSTNSPGGVSALP
jgi:hypothetical protein